jgi:hypothetical protein
MSNKRKQFSAQFKARVALAALELGGIGLLEEPEH